MEKLSRAASLLADTCCFPFIQLGESPENGGQSGWPLGAGSGAGAYGRLVASRGAKRIQFPPTVLKSRGVPAK